MKPVFALARAFLRTSLREGNSLFWLWIFPLLLLALLGSIFGRVERGEFSLRVGLVNLDRGPLGQEIERVLAEPTVPVQLAPLPVGRPSEELLEAARKEVSAGRIHAVLVIPPNFSTCLLQNVSASPPRVEIFYRRGEAGSSTAASILAEIVEEFCRTALVHAGVLTEHVEVAVQKVGGEARTVKYAEFLLPGVLLMTLFVTAIFSVPTIVLYAKETGILRRYLATPLSGGQYFLGSALGMAFLNGAQIVSLWALGWLALGVRLPLLRPESLAFLFLSFATFMALGFLISTLSRTHQGAMALANLLNLPLQFLGGLYFPITSLPKALRIIMAVNPLTHLAEGWRAALGLSSSSFPLWANLLVPFLWLLGSAALAVKRMRFGEEG